MVDNFQEWFRTLDNSASKDNEQGLIPIHAQNSHRALICINIANKEILYFDSIMSDSRSQTYLSAVKRWVADESRNSLGTEWDTSQWLLAAPKCPQQENGNDCVCDYVAENLPLDFRPNEIDAFRKRIMLQILAGQLRS